MSVRAWIQRACALSTIGVIGVVGWAGVVTAADSDWRYVIGQSREKQQANFCSTRESVEEIARIFDRFGPRTGYAALSASPDCAIAVHSFTPRALLMAVTISEGKPGEYQLRFVEVERDHGATMYLVTTREVVTE